MFIKSKRCQDEKIQGGKHKLETKTRSHLFQQSAGMMEKHLQAKKNMTKQIQKYFQKTITSLVRTSTFALVTSSDTILISSISCLILTLSFSVLNNQMLTFSATKALKMFWNILGFEAPKVEQRRGKSIFSKNVPLKSDVWIILANIWQLRSSDICWHQGTKGGYGGQGSLFVLET